MIFNVTINTSIHPFFFAPYIAFFLIPILYVPFYVKSYRPIARIQLGIGKFSTDSHAETSFPVLSSENEGDINHWLVFIRCTPSVYRILLYYT